MRIWFLFCCAVIVGEVVFESARAAREQPAMMVESTRARSPLAESETTLAPQTTPQEPGLFSLLTLGVVMLGAASHEGASGLHEPDARLAICVGRCTRR
jgi:hypothetical protein